MLPTVAEGENFSMRVLQRSWLHCEIWRRPDLSRADGARLAAEIADHMGRLASGYAGLVFDLRRATPIWGPATEAAIVRMFAPWEALGKPILVVPSDEAIQHIALRNLITEASPRGGRLVDDIDTALAEIDLTHSIRGGPQSRGPQSRAALSEGPVSQRSRVHRS